MTDFRALCAELIEYLSLLDDPPHELVVRAKAALAEREPDEPTDQEIMEWANAVSEVPLQELVTGHGWRLCFKEDEFADTIRAALTRWS